MLNIYTYDKKPKKNSDKYNMRHEKERMKKEKKGLMYIEKSQKGRGKVKGIYVLYLYI